MPYTLPSLPPLKPLFLELPGPSPGPLPGPINIGFPPTGPGQSPTGPGKSKIYDSNGRCVSGCDAIDQGLNQGMGGTQTVWSIPWGRLAAFLLGLLLIGAGLWMIRPINQSVQVVAGHAKHIGAALAEA